MLYAELVAVCALAFCAEIERKGAVVAAYVHYGCVEKAGVGTEVAFVESEIGHSSGLVDAEACPTGHLGLLRRDSSVCTAHVGCRRRVLRTFGEFGEIFPDNSSVGRFGRQAVGGEGVECQPIRLWGENVGCRCRRLGSAQRCRMESLCGEGSCAENAE